MTTPDARRALPFSPGELVYQSTPYIYTSGTVPVKERDAEFVFYQTWTDARAEQKNVDVSYSHFNPILQRE